MYERVAHPPKGKRRRIGIYTEDTEGAENTEKTKKVQELKVEELKEEDRLECGSPAPAFAVWASLQP